MGPSFLRLCSMSAAGVLALALLSPLAAVAQAPVPPGSLPSSQSSPNPRSAPNPKPAPQSKPAANQKPAANPAAKAPDGALRADAERRAGPLVLASADGERTCPVQLKTATAGGGFSLSFGGDGCPMMPFTAEVAAWVPDPSGAILFLTAQGRQVAEFTEGAGGAYEALREGDGVYFLAPASMLQEDMVRPEEMLGEWDIARTAGTPLCRWVFSEAAAKGGGLTVSVSPGCDAGLAAFAPAAWHLEGGNVLVTSRAGATTLRFARQEDGGWAKIPERGRPLLMSRP
ncbi:AprI/Inh family metalloprotease inhibitor [Xanthobacteraceae bacterium A53D]